MIFQPPSKNISVQNDHLQYYSVKNNCFETPANSKVTVSCSREQLFVFIISPILLAARWKDLDPPNPLEIVAFWTPPPLPPHSIKFPLPSVEGVWIFSGNTTIILIRHLFSHFADNNFMLEIYFLEELRVRKERF